MSDTDRVRLIVLDSAHRTLRETYAEYQARRTSETLHKFEQVYHLFCLLAGCYEWAGCERTTRPQRHKRFAKGA